jgi:DNA-binding NarL/FixJ family response regulator
VPERVRILLIDDHALFREAISRMLAAQPDFEVVGEGSTVEEGIGVIRSSIVDLVLLDVDLGAQQGGAFLKLARAEGFEGKVLVVTAGVNDLEAARLLQRGCAGIFLKHERPPLLMERIRSIVAGDAQPEPSATQAAMGSTAGRTSASSLTYREHQVLRCVFGGQSNKEIAFQLDISEPAVKAALQRLFGKEGVRNRAQLVRAAVERYSKELAQDAGS